MKPTARLLLGDCRLTLRDIPDNSVDGCACDPPYGLSDEPDIVEVLTHWLAGDEYEYDSSGFMGKDWDSFVPGPDYWREVYRVLKPGAHLVAFSSSRTEDLLGISIRLAGFERRDLIAWLYWTGFPKSLDVSKEFDRMRDDEAEIRAVCRLIRSAMESRGVKSKNIAKRFGFHSRMVDHWAARDTDSQPTLPKWDQWLALKEALGIDDEMDAEVWRLNGRKGTPGEAWSERAVLSTERMTDTTKVRLGMPCQSRERKDVEITAANSDEAKQWDGWGTHLKPALEPALVFRKPISESSIARNVRRWGTGALNIDATRYRIGDPAWPGPQEDAPETHSRNVDSDIYGDFGTQETHTTPGQTLGRFPANVYACKKPSTEERETGCHHLPKMGAAELVDRVEDSDGMNSPRAGAGRTSGGRSNHHPTLKPVRLMRWLCRLITPPGGVVLDPFMGPGTTGVAAMSERLSFIGCEMEADYMPIAVARIDHASMGADVEAPDGTREKRLQPSLFGVKP